jgi:hypothetical protein
MSINKTDIPDGEYDAVWSGFNVEVFLPGFILSSFSAVEVNRGIKGSKSTKVDIISGYLYIGLTLANKRDLKINNIIG